jgi:outer membrane protein assembly factor BamB
VLYALDGETGDELWSSKDQITSWNHFSGLSIANGRVYIGTYDGMLYCFGAASLPARTSTTQAPPPATETKKELR